MSKVGALWQASLTATKRALTWNIDDMLPPSQRFIYNFNSKQELKKWHLYSDSEYGGLSSAALEINDAGKEQSGPGVFSGNLSLDVTEGTKWNISRSGFCGMRSKKFDGFIDLDPYDTITLRVKGDDRSYISTIYTENWVNSPGQMEDNSWQAFVCVPKDNWIVAKIRLSHGSHICNNSRPFLQNIHKKECSETEVKNGYKKLALKWHPDRCSAEEAKKNFQAIQEAYSVLSDANKRFLYDVGVYDGHDDENGMADFMREMASMMSQNKPNENGESFEELKDLFEDLFESDVESFGWTSHAETSTSSLLSSSSSSNKRGSSTMSNTKSQDPLCFDASFQGFSQGADTRRGAAAGGRRRRRGDMFNVVI